MNRKGKRRAMGFWKRWWAVLLLCVLAAGAVALVAPLRAVGTCYERLSVLSDATYVGGVMETAEAKRALDDVQRCAASRFIDHRVTRRFFPEFHHAEIAHYEARHFFHTGHYDRVIGSVESMPGYEDDHRAQHMLGVAKFKILQAKYKAGNARDKREAVEAVVNEVSKHFHRSLEIRFTNEDRWNYDVTIDPRLAQEALEGREPTEEYMLGPGEDGAPSEDGEGENSAPGDEIDGEQDPGIDGEPQRKG